MESTRAASTARGRGAAGAKGPHNERRQPANHMKLNRFSAMPRTIFAEVAAESGCVLDFAL